jgi:amidase
VLPVRDGEGVAGPLSGQPIVVKGRAGLASVQTRRLMAAGAVPIAIGSTPRGSGYQTWGHTARGPTRNPWRGDLSPGGSSAGSAAAVAAGLVELATGTDGAGSVRIPAAWCGVFGYKPTTALAAACGACPPDPAGLTVPGPLARDPALLGAWAAAVLGDLPVAPAIRTIGWSADLGFVTDVDAEVAATAERAAVHLAASARLHRPGVRPPVLADPRAVWEAARAGCGPPARGGNDAELARYFAVADLLATPTTPGPPHGHDGPGEHYSVSLTWGFNLSGHPAVSVPAGFTRAGAPVGLQLVARPGADAALLDLVRRTRTAARLAPWT